MSLNEWMKQPYLQGHVVVKKEKLISFKITTKKGQIGLYKSSTIKKSNKVKTAIANSVNVVAGSGITKGGRELIKVLYGNRYYWAIRKNRLGNKQLEQVKK